MSDIRDQLLSKIQTESKLFQDYCLWLEEAMPAIFFEEVTLEHVMLIIHNLMGFDVREHSATIHLKNVAISMSLDQADTDLKILQNHSTRGIHHYQAYVSKTPPPFLGINDNLRIVIIYFTEGVLFPELVFPIVNEQALFEKVKAINTSITKLDFESLLSVVSTRFLHSLSLDLQALALAMFYRAKTRDQCQYEVRYIEDWQEKKTGSMQIVLGWKNTPKHNFLYRLVRVIRRHGLIVKSINSTSTNPYQTENILLAVFELHGAEGKAVWDVADILEFIKELVTVKYFASFDAIDLYLVSKGIVSGSMGNFLRAMVTFVHQSLVHLDVNLYNINNVEEALCRHPEFTATLCEAFKYKFSPSQIDLDLYDETSKNFLIAIDKLDTGHEENDVRRKNILRQGMNFIHFMLKTNFYRPNFTALSFRMDPAYLDEIPFDRAKKFPELPFAIIFIKGMHFIGFHIRFRDLARGGLRTVFPEHTERMLLERNNVFTECYHLALTQQMKNKDIPEGGAKGIILLMPYERLESEAAVLKSELLSDDVDAAEVEVRVEKFRQEQRTEHLYQAQRSFIESLLILVNCDPTGKIRARDIVDYWQRPEYLYLGPDENMHDVMIQWIAEYSKKIHYKAGSAFISGKPVLGINHKEYGVTSLGVNVYMDAVLRYIGIDPTITQFTIKMAGGPDGDVAGNQICNLQKYYPKTAKLIALTDVTGTIYEPCGLDLDALVDLFHSVRGIRHYPPQKLTEGGFLVDKNTKRYQTALVQQTLCWRRVDGQLQEDWLSGSDMNHLIRNNVHTTYADIFIPAGGRPRTLNEVNYAEFLDETGKPTSKAIIEGANLYLTPKARRIYEEKGTLVIKDSSANKTGVICSSFEVLSGLTLGDEKFILNKPVLVAEILQRLKQCALNEAQLLLETHAQTGEFLTEISERISKRINLFTDQLLDFLENETLSSDPNDPLIHSFLQYCLPVLRKNYQANLLKEIPDQHKKAIIACYIGAGLVYSKGLTWFPSIVDVLPMCLAMDNDL